MINSLIVMFGLCMKTETMFRFSKSSPLLRASHWGWHEFTWHWNHLLNQSCLEKHPQSEDICFGSSIFPLNARPLRSQGRGGVPSRQKVQISRSIAVYLCSLWFPPRHRHLGTGRGLGQTLAQLMESKPFGCLELLVQESGFYQGSS